MLVIFKIHRWFIYQKRLDIFQLHHCEIVQLALIRAIIWMVKSIVGVKNHGNEIIANASNWIIHVFNVSLCTLHLEPFELTDGVLCDRWWLIEKNNNCFFLLSQISKPNVRMILWKYELHSMDHLLVYYIQLVGVVVRI